MLDVWVQVRLGCNSELILDEFGEKLLEELDYQQEARNIQARAQIAAPTLAMSSRDTRLNNMMLLPCEHERRMASLRKITGSSFGAANCELSLSSTHSPATIMEGWCEVWGSGSCF